MRIRRVFSPDGLPAEEEAVVVAVWDRGELVPREDAEDVGPAAVLVLCAPGITDYQGTAIRAGPENLLPADGWAEPVLVEEGLAGADGVLGDLEVAAGAAVMRRVEAGCGDDPGAVRSEERIAGREGAAPGSVWVGHDDLRRRERRAGGGGVQDADVHGV